MMQPTIRRATLEDADSLAEIHVAAWEGSYRGILPDEEFEKRPLVRRRAQWRDSLERGTHVVLAACDDRGSVIGFAGARPLDPPVSGFQSYLATLYVRPELKRRGIGSALLRAIAAEMLALGANSMVLRTLRLGAARKFYERLGGRFIPEGIAIDSGVFDDAVYAFDDLRALAASP